MAKTRDPWFDNARWLAGSLVVVVHLTTGYMTGGEVGDAGGLSDWLHSATQPIRLPLFSMLVGYFTPLRPTDADFQKLIRYVVIPFSLISLLHVLFVWATQGEVLFDPVIAPYTLWFMFAVIIWRAAAPYLWQLRAPLLVAIAASLFAGMFHSLWVFGLYSVTGFLPFFMLGLLLQRDDAWLREKTPRTTAIAAGIVAAWVGVITVLFFLQQLDRSIIGMTTSYEAEDMAGNYAGMAFRLLVIVTSGATMIAGFHLVPRRHIPIISYVGAGGFSIYLLHGLVIRIVRWVGLLPTQEEVTWWTEPVLILLGFALALALGSKPVRWLAKPLVRPDVQRFAFAKR